MTIKSLYPNVRPTLNLNFARTKALDPRITFTRASTGTFAGSNGLIQTAASGVARFDHNPATGESLGLLVEEARTNSLLYSQQFDNAAWGKNSSTITSSAAVAPDGTSTAQKLVEDASNATHSITVGVPSDTYKTVTLFAKAAERNWIGIGLFDTARGWVYSFFNLSTGAIGTNPDGNAVITALSNGWYRIQIGRQANAGSTLRILLQTANGTNTYNGDSNNYTGNGSSGVFIWGAQVEAGAFPTSYIPTTTATVTRAADVVGIAGTNFSSWYNQAGGTVLINYKRYPVSTFTYPTPWMIRDSVGGAYSNGIQVFGEAGATYDRLSGTNFTATPSVTLPNPYSRQDKNAAAFINGSQNMAVNGTIGTASSSSIYTSGTVNQLVIGLNFTFKSFTYYPVRLPDAQLQALTS
jgi:hypothetical protein